METTSQATKSIRKATAMIARAERHGLGRNSDATIAGIQRHLAAAHAALCEREELGEDVQAESDRYFAASDRASLAGLR